MPTIYGDAGGMTVLGPSQIGRAAKITILTRITATGGPLALATIDLFVNSATPGPLSLSADFTLPTWTGYTAASAITWGTAAGEGQFGATIEGSSINWVSGSNADTLIYGWVVKTAGGLYVYGRRLDDPVPVVGVQSITVVPAVVFG